MMNMIEKNMHQGTCEYGLPHTVVASGILLSHEFTSENLPHLEQV